MHYYADIEKDPDGGFIATFSDVPQAVTGGDDYASTLENARDALTTILLHLADEGQAFPPATAQQGVPIFVPAHARCKMELICAFQEANITKTELAARLEKQESEARRILDPFHHTKLSTMEHALNVLGRKFVISVQAAE